MAEADYRPGEVGWWRVGAGSVRRRVRTPSSLLRLLNCSVVYCGKTGRNHAGEVLFLGTVALEVVVPLVIRYWLRSGGGVKKAGGFGES